MSMGFFASVCAERRYLLACRPSPALLDRDRATRERRSTDRIIDAEARRRDAPEPLTEFRSGQSHPIHCSCRTFPAV
jgi:hypothetical protein